MLSNTKTAVALALSCLVANAVKLEDLQGHPAYDLSLTVESADLLVNTGGGFDRKMDPYVHIVVRQKSADDGSRMEWSDLSETDWEGGTFPSWHETFSINSATHIQFDVYDEDVGRDDFIGGGFVTLSDICADKSEFETSVALSNGAATGSVSISGTCTPV